MVYDSETYEICHHLTKDGKKRYREILEKAADEILWRHEHPVKAFFKDVKDWLDELLMETF